MNILRTFLLMVIVCGLFSIHSVSHAQSPASARAEARWLLERITGVRWPGNSPIVQQMEQRIASGDRMGAADIATSQPQFLNVAVKQMALQMSSREETVTEPFNDFTASFMGVARDNTDARELLTGNFYYRGDVANKNNLIPDILGSNEHYLELGRSPNIAAALRRVEGQEILTSPVTTAPNPDPAGVLTSRAFLAAHAVAGTNRRLVEFAFREFMCVKIENWADTSASDARIGRDISRSPGGSPIAFQTSCKGCHTVMDGFRGAFAKWDFVAQGGLSTPAYVGVSEGNLSPARAQNNLVVSKMNRDRNPNIFIEYPSGYVTTNDSWVNNANRGTNAMRFGWSREPAGSGVKSFGQLLATSSRFSSCMAQRVWDSVCKYSLPAAEAEALHVSLGIAFANSGYRLKELFKVVAIHPKCRM